MADKAKFGDTMPPVGADSAESDPFEELTRIMGFDPREPVAPKAAREPAVKADAAVADIGGGYADAPHADDLVDDFGIDLEREMLAHFEQDEPVAEVASVEALAPAKAVSPVDASASASTAIDDVELDDENAFDAVFAEDVGALEASFSSAEPISVDAAPETVEAPVQANATLAVSTNDAELDDDDKFDVFFAEEVDALEASFSSESFASADAPVPAQAEMSSEHSGIVAEQDQAVDLVDDVSALEASFSGGAAPQLEKPTAFDADVDILNATFASRDVENAGLETIAGDDTAFDDEVALGFDETPEPMELSNADDFALDDFEIDMGDIEAAIGEQIDQAQTLHQETAIAASAEQDHFADIDMDFAANEASFAPSPLTARASDTRPANAGHPLREDLDDLIAALDAVNNRPVKQKATDGSTQQATVTTEVNSSALANMTNPYQTRDINAWRQPEQSKHSRDFAPDVQTTEMFDQAYSLADDLDLPDVGYDEPQRGSSDLDLEFDSLLNEISRGAPAARATHSVAPQAPYDGRAPVRRDDNGFDSVFGQAPQPRQAAYKQPVQQAAEFDDFSFDDLDFDSEAETVQPVYRPRNGGGGGRGMMIALLVGGVALLGGIGAFAMSWSGEGGAPALITADASPIKVRPENPGGASVPNQDSAVYDTVSRSGGAANPGQERLVSSTEDPIDIPLPDDADNEELAGLSKSEDRIEPTNASADAAQDPLAVAPRKVRTMIVKPDGSLVPAEMPVAAQTAEPSVENIAAASVEEPEQITTGTTQVSPVETASVAPAAPGGWTVQIASQPSEDGANKSLKTMGKRYAGAIGDRGLHIVKAEVEGKGTYWRVRVAAASRDDAVNVCSSMKSAGGSCFVTR